MTNWIQAAAEELHDQMDAIEGEAGQAAQVDQDSHSGFIVWRMMVMDIIAKHYRERRSHDSPLPGL